MSSYGYGLFNMNLNALHNPVSKGFQNWSVVLEIKPNVEYEIEGFNFLGLGVLLFIPLSVVFVLFRFRKNLARTVFGFLKHNFGILVSSAALVVFALGEWVTFGGLKLFRIPFPEGLVNGLFGIFRANGRFGNILVYLIVLFVLVLTATSCKKHIAALLLGLLLFVQVFDLRYVLRSKYNYFHGIEDSLCGQQVNLVIHNSFWDDAAQRYDAVYLFSGGYPNINIDLAVKFAKKHKKVNTQLEARIDYAKNEETKAEIFDAIRENRFTENALIVLDGIPEDLIRPIADGGYSVFYTENAYILCKSVFSQAEILQYATQGDFHELHAPYIA